MVDTCVRGRWHGSLHELVEAFQPEVTCFKFVIYRKVVAPPKGRNWGHRLLFRRLRALHDKLCFRDTDVTAALKIISKQRVWFYEHPGHRDAWTTDLSAMVRSMLRDIRQAMICSPKGAWLRKLWDTSRSVVYYCMSSSSYDHHLLHSCLGTGMRGGT